ncbi:MAG: hypothetical protein NVS2B17_16670 [Candidatus Velthaea sp.]
MISKWSFSVGAGMRRGIFSGAVGRTGSFTGGALFGFFAAMVLASYRKGVSCTRPITMRYA